MIISLNRTSLKSTYKLMFLSFKSKLNQKNIIIFNAKLIMKNSTHCGASEKNNFIFY